jgi:hypothetical protein
MTRTTESPLAIRDDPRSIAGSILTIGGPFLARNSVSLTFATADLESTAALT